MKKFKLIACLVFGFCTAEVVSKTNLTLVDPNYECELDSKNKMEWQVSECMQNKAGKFDLPLEAAYNHVYYRAERLEDENGEKETALTALASMHENWLKFRDGYCEAESRILYQRPMDITFNEAVCKQQLNQKQINFYNELN